VLVGRLLVRPPWVEVNNPDAIHLVLDAGRAFGTGSHPSTTLALALLEDALPGSVLDVGSGSGALSIGAALLGASRVTAIDIDDGAVETTRANAEANGVAVDVSSTPLAEVPGTYDIVVANLGSPLVVDLAPGIAARAGTTIILSGLLADRWEHVPPAYPGFDVAYSISNDEWRALSLERSGTSRSSHVNPKASTTKGTA
jgi:ribosomal protein L11 methyltransferase